MNNAQTNLGMKTQIEGMLAGVSSLETRELEVFFQQVAQVLASRKAPALSKRESDLLLKINAGYPSVFREKYEKLSAKKEVQEISQNEKKELIALAEKFESMDLERLGYLLELAQLRRIPLEKLLENLSQPAHG